MTRARENADGGLVLIGTANPSAASSTTFTNLTAGKTYKIVGRVIGTTTATGFYGRFREGSTDKTTGYAAFQWGTISGTTGYFDGQGTTLFSLGTLGTQASNKVTFFSVDLYVHTDGTAAYIQGQSMGADSSAANSPRQVQIAAHNLSMSACNGINLYASSGNITGSIKLYEYR